MEIISIEYDGQEMFFVGSETLEDGTEHQIPLGMLEAQIKQEIAGNAEP